MFIGNGHPLGNDSPADANARPRVPESLWKRISGWIGRNPAPTLTAIGLFTYGLLRLDYVLFYDQLGVTPEDVGLTYVNILAQSLVGVAVLIVMFGMSFFIIVALVFSGLIFIPLGLFIGLVFRRPLLWILQFGRSLSKVRSVAILVLLLVASLFLMSKSSLDERFWYVTPLLFGTVLGLPLVMKAPDDLRPGRPRAIISYAYKKIGEAYRDSGLKARYVAVMFVLVGTEMMLLLLPIFTFYEAQGVKEGRSISALRIPSDVPMPILALHAERAQVYKDVGASPNPTEKGLNMASVISGDCWMYLGQAQNIAVFYDAWSKKVIRLPSGDLTISIRIDDDCPSRRQERRGGGPARVA